MIYFSKWLASMLVVNWFFLVLSVPAWPNKVHKWLQKAMWFIYQKKKTNSRGNLAGLRRRSPHPRASFSLSPRPPLRGSPPFPGNKGGTWPAGFDVYFSRPFPRCLGFFCVRPGTTNPPPPPPENKRPGASSALDPGSGDVLYLNP